MVMSGLDGSRSIGERQGDIRPMISIRDGDGNIFKDCHEREECDAGLRPVDCCVFARLSISVLANFANRQSVKVCFFFLSILLKTMDASAQPESETNRWYKASGIDNNSNIYDHTTWKNQSSDVVNKKNW